MPEDIYIPEDYSSARNQFLDTARSCGARIDSHRNQNAEIDDIELFLDVASLGSECADRFLVVSSGVHGVEGFAGSMVQTALLESVATQDLPSAMSVLMVHAVNPFGFAHLRRVNEDNIDLNRNFVDFSKPLPKNTDYQRLANVIAPLKGSVLFKLVSTLRILLYQLRYGQAGLQKAVTQGQYSHPEGLFYGGRSPAWSRQTLEKIVEQKLSRARKVVWVDLHTGLGPYGHGELIMYEPKDSEAGQRALKCWGTESVRFVVDGNSVSADLSGTLNSFVHQTLDDAEVTIAGLEFGTLQPMKVFRRLQGENRMSVTTEQISFELKKARIKLMEAFCPDDEGWRKRVCQQSLQVYENAMSFLCK